MAKRLDDAAKVVGHAVAVMEAKAGAAGTKVQEGVEAAVDAIGRSAPAKKQAARKAVESRRR